jgi:hypothetical protein
MMTGTETTAFSTAKYFDKYNFSYIFFLFNIIKKYNIMKKIPQIVAILGLLFVLQSCTKEPLSFKFDLSSFEGCLSANPYYGPEQYYFLDVNTADITKAITDRSYKVDDLKEIKLGKVSINVSSTGVSFDEIANVAIYARPFSATPPTKPTRGEKQLAYSESISSGSTALDLKVTGASLIDLIKNNQKIQLVMEVLNKDKVGGTQPICVKTDATALEITVQQK